MNTHSHPLWTADEAMQATGGTCNGAWSAMGVSINTRSIKPGDLFIALKGPKLDGHDYVGTALAADAAAAVVDHTPAAVSPDAPLLQVKDTFVALEALGRHARGRAQGVSVIAVTGSVGKTGVKEALAHVLGEQGATHASEGSLNNHWGLPLSLARMAADVRFAVLEMGMNHAGELTPLSKMARPHVCVITTIQPAHTAFFKSLDDIADAKAEVFAGGESGWRAVLNRDIDQYDRLVAAATSAGAAEIISFGEHADADVRLLSETHGAGPSTVSASVMGTAIDYTVGIAGKHWVRNSLCVLAAVHAAGGDIERAARAMAGLQPPVGRGQRFEITLGGGAFELIDESYNASPASMAAALAVLSAKRPAGRRVAVLGDMLEMGDESATRHRNLKDDVLRANLDAVFLAGAAMKNLGDALPAGLIEAQSDDADVLAGTLAQWVRPGDVVMVKGSAGVGMGRVVDALRKLDASERNPD